MIFKRKFLYTFCLTFLFIVFTPIVTHAEDGELITPQFKQQVDQLKESSGLLDGFLVGQSENLFNIGGVNSAQNLIFGNPYTVWMNGDGKTAKVNYGIFYDDEWKKVIQPMINLFAACYGVFITLSIMIASLRFGLKAYSPQAKSDFWTDVNMWVLSAFFMGTFGWFCEVLFGLNEGVTQSIKNILTAHGVDVKGMSIIAFASNFTVGDVFVFLAEWGLDLYLNIIYVARKIIIILLLILSPVAAISLLYAKTRSFFGSWVKEMVSNIFLQSIHAVVIGIFAGLATLGAGMIFKLGMILFFIPVTGMITKWLNLGDSSTALGRSANMMGLSGVAGALMLTRAAGSVIKGGNFSNIGGSNHGGSTVQNLGGDNLGTNITAAATGSHSPGWQSAKSAIGLAGGIAGATMGLPFGGAGVGIGGALGKKAGEMVTQGARNVVSGGLNFGRVASQMPMQYSGGEKGWAGFKTGAKNMWNDLSARRQYMGNLGESLGSMVGFGEKGRAMGQMLSGVSQGRIQEEQFGNKTLEDYAKENPGAAVQWRQSNQGSAFYMDMGGGQFRQISAMGANDPSLKQGEQRAVDYKLNDGNNWVRQENGGYVASPSTVTPTRPPIYGSNGQILSNSRGLTSNLQGNTGGSLTGSVGIASVTPSTTNPVITATPDASAVGSGGLSGGPSSGIESSPVGEGVRKVVGLSGSTASLGRTSGSYILGSDGKKFEDTRVQPKNINPDQYFAHNIAGVNRKPLRDKGADVIHGGGKKFNQAHENLSSWRQRSNLEAKLNRHSGVI
jgi:hypothetical protein